MDVPFAKTYRPTRAEFEDPLLYIQSIRAEAQLYGIVKIIPPEVEFLTKLTSFWQREHRARDRPAVPAAPRYWNINEPSGAAAAAAANSNASSPQQPSKHGKRRTEAALLMDSRRRPRDKMPEPVAAAAEAASSVPVQPAAAGSTSLSAEQTVFNSSSMVHELRMAASAYASGGRGVRSAAASGSSMTDGPKSSAPSARHSFDVLAVSDDFTLGDVHVKDGVIVAPTLRGVQDSKGYNPSSGLAEVDLFILFELVTRRWNGFGQLSKKQWIDVLRQLLLTERIMDKQHLFQANEEPRTLEFNDEEQDRPAAKKGKKLADDLPAHLLTQSVADELCTVYRTHLLPYEQYVSEHLRSRAQQSRLPAPRPSVDLSKPTSMELDDDDSATNDEPKSTAAAAASFSSAAAASTSCIANAASHSSGVELGMPAPTFSMNDIRQWQQVRAMKAHLQAQLSEHSAEPQPAAAAATASGSRSTRMGSVRQPKSAGTDPSICAVCKTDTLASMCQCYHCQSSFHFGCLSPPLSSSPLLPWYCPDCASSFSFGFTQGNEYDLLSYKNEAAFFRHCWFASRQSPYTDSRCPHHARFLQRDSASSRSVDAVDCICRIPPDEIVRTYWQVVESGSHQTPITVEYGSDIDTAAPIGPGAADGCSAFPSTGPYSRNGWNLNNLPALERSLLRHMRNVSGVTVPWMYIGMMLSSFCWHTEDHYTYSINYLHQGDIKQWYGVPSHAATAFEAQTVRTLPHLFSRQPDLMSHMVTMISPSTLQAAGVPVYQIQQSPGEFVLTFPQAYHGGFNHGTNVAEAVNFAPADWLAFGIRSGERYRVFQRTPVFSTEQLIIQLAAEPLLDSYTACWLDQCLQHVVAEELVMREHLRASGLTHATRWTNQLHFQLFGVHPTKHDSEDVAAAATGTIPFKQIRGKAKHRTMSRTVCVTNQCVACKHAVYISAVSCKCEASRGQIACPRHAAYLCGCPASEQTLLMRLDCDQLSRLVARVQRKVSHLSASHTFTKLDHKRGEPVETVAEIQTENRENMQDTEIPYFCIEPDEAAIVDPMPSFASATSLKSAKKKAGKSSGADLHESINAEFAPQRTEALHNNYLFLQSSQQSHNDRVLNSHLLQGAEASAASSASAQVAASFLHPTLEHIGGSLYPVQVVVTPMQKELIIAPPVDTVRDKVESACISWMKKIKPYLVTAFQLEREYNKQLRLEKRERGEETDTSDDESAGSDEGASEETDQLALQSLHLSLEAEKSIEDEVRIDRELRKLIKHKMFDEPPVKGSQRSKAAAARSPPPAKLSPSTLQSLIEEGRSLIWSSTYAREVNLVFDQLTQWQDVVTRINRLSDAVDQEEAMRDEDGEEQKQSDRRAVPSPDAKKETLDAARRLVDAVSSIPLDLDSSSSSSASAASSVPGWSSQLQRGVAALKRTVAAAELVESSIKRALEPENWAVLTLEQRNSHPRLLSFDELCELQERANGLLLSFPDTARLAAHINRSSVLLRRAGAVLGVRPPPAAFTVDRALQFSPSYRPWRSGSDAALAAQLSAENDQNASGRSDAQVYNEGNQVQAEQLLSKLVALPLKHDYLSRLSSGLSSMHDFENRVHRMLYFCPGHAIPKDRESFSLDELDKADRHRVDAERKACVSYATLVGLWTGAQSNSAPSSALVKRLEKLHTAVQTWRVSMAQLMQRVVEAFRLLVDPAPTDLVRRQTSMFRAEAAKRHKNHLCAFVDEQSLNALLHASQRNGVFGIPEFTAYRRIRDLAPFFLRMHTTFTATLRSHAGLFDFTVFQPAAWLDKLDRVFEPTHPLRPEWKNVSWRHVLGVSSGASSPRPLPVLPPSTDDPIFLQLQNAVSPAQILQARQNKLNHLHPVSIDEADEPAQAAAAGARPSGDEAATASAPKRASASELASPEKRHKAGPASSSANVTASASVADSETSDFEMLAPSTAAAASSSSFVSPPKPKSTGKAATKMLERVCNSASTLSVPDLASLFSMSQACVEQLRSEMPAAGGSTSVAAAQLAAATRSLVEPVLTLLEAQVIQLEALLRLLARLQQHLNHLQPLYEANLPPPAIATAAWRSSQQRCAEYLQSASAPMNLPSAPSSSCCYYPSPRVCPWYSSDELDHLRALDKFVHRHFGLTLQYHDTLQTICAKVQRYSLAIKRLIGSPCITEKEAMEPNQAVFNGLILDRQKKYTALLDKRSYTLFVEQQLPSGSHPSPASASSAVSPLLSAMASPLDVSDQFWQGVHQSILEECDFDFNVPLHVLLISGESSEPRLEGRHHTIGAHLQQNADRVALENGFNQLYSWCDRAEQSLELLRAARVWCAANPLRLGRAGDAVATPFVPLLTQAHDCAVAVTTEHSKYVGPLKRKLEQGLWSLRVYMSLMRHRSLAEIRELSTTQFFFRATIAQEAAKTGRASFIQDKVSPMIPMPAGVSLCSPEMCETVHRSMLAVPANEFELCSALDVLQQCISAGLLWEAQAQQLLVRIEAYQAKVPSPDEFDRLMHPLPSSPGRQVTAMELAAQRKKVSQLLQSVGLSSVSVEELQALASSACQCLSVPVCLQLQRIKECLAFQRLVHERFPPPQLAAPAAPSSAFPMLMDAHGNALQPFIHPPFPPITAPAVQPMRRDDLIRLIWRGQSTLLATPELRHLYDVESLNSAWIQRLDGMFWPRHPNLSLARHLQSMYVPITAEKDAAQVQQHMAQADRKQQPKCDATGLYCICKEKYDRTALMLTCDTCAESYHDACVGVSVQQAARLRSYCCPKCCEKSSTPYPFGPVVFRHSRPTLTGCYAQLSWLDSQLRDRHALSRFQCDHAESLRQVLARIEEFKAFVQPWLQPTVEAHERKTAALAANDPRPSDPAEAAAASSAIAVVADAALDASTSMTDVPAAASAPAAAATGAYTSNPAAVSTPPVAPSSAAAASSPALSSSSSAHPPSSLSTALDSATRSLIKGCIRQGKKMGINFPELGALKKRYDQARAEAKNQQQQAAAAATAAADASPAAAAAPASVSRSAHPSPEREVLMIDE